ncbi:TIGR00730 family Rossman fold protein [Polycladidibacter stylochi]|uniref:LOG family protein n=1 Tax=Polycladidibacter stylochi TaxID=1807766 RepID=UPI000AD2DC62|nr:TIGR00730 family Rossman fold protein [Pseudovibrio stylochi]
MRSICVFCGSSAGAKPAYEAAAQSLGHYLAKQNISLVYGGARVGLMGTIADALLEAGGHVTGVLPKALQELEIAHPDIQKLHIVKSMHERKAMMAQLSDGFITLPGGIGTLEELFEVWTWGQLGYHNKPLGFLNVENYFDPLLEFIDHMVTERFLKAENQSMLAIAKQPQELIELMQAYKPPRVSKIIHKEEI